MGFILLTLRWGNLTLYWFDLLEIIPSGFGTGLSSAAAFVALNAGIDKKDQAVASSGFYLSASLGEVAGLSASDAMIKYTVRNRLLQQLSAGDNAKQVSANTFEISNLTYH